MRHYLYRRPSKKASSPPLFLSWLRIVFFSPWFSVWSFSKKRRSLKSKIWCQLPPVRNSDYCFKAEAATNKRIKENNFTLQKQQLKVAISNNLLILIKERQIKSNNKPNYYMSSCVAWYCKNELKLPPFELISAALAVKISITAPPPCCSPVHSGYNKRCGNSNHNNINLHKSRLMERLTVLKTAHFSVKKADETPEAGARPLCFSLVVIPAARFKYAARKKTRRWQCDYRRE